MIYIKVVSEPASRILGEYNKEKVHGNMVKHKENFLIYLVIFFLRTCLNCWPMKQ